MEKASNAVMDAIAKNIRPDAPPDPADVQKLAEVYRPYLPDGRKYTHHALTLAEFVLKGYVHRVDGYLTALEVDWMFEFSSEKSGIITLAEVARLDVSQCRRIKQGWCK